MSPNKVYSSVFFAFFISLVPPLLWANVEIPDYYQEPGYSPFRQSGMELLGDNVDPFSGQLSIAHTDFYIPGNGGLDLKIIRSYNSYRAGKPLTGKSLVGQGWDIHMGRVYFNGTLSASFCPLHKQNPTSEDNPVLELPDGTRKVLYPSKSYSLGGSSRSPDFITKDFWIGDCINNQYTEGGVTYNEGGIIITSPQGTQYRFDRQFRTQSGALTYVVTEIKDPRGNRINIDYWSKANALINNVIYAIIDRVTTSDSRFVRFYYNDKSDDEIPILTSISSGNRTVKYFYNEEPLFLYLKTVNQSNGGSWDFSYYPYTNPICSSNCNQIAIARSNKISVMRSPLGARVDYDYNLIPSGINNGVTPAVIVRGLNLGSGGTTNPLADDGSTTSTTSNDTTNSDTTGGTGGVIGDSSGSSGGSVWFPDYLLKSSSGSKSTNGNVSGIWTYDYNLGSSYDETTINTPTSKEVYRHFGSKAANNGSVWRIGTLLYKSISGGGVTQTETYNWNSIILSSQNEKRKTRTTLQDNDIRLPILLSKNINRDGTNYSTTYSNHDVMGNPENITENSNAIREETIGSSAQTVSNTKSTSVDYHYDLGDWILAQIFRERVDGSFNTGPQNSEPNWNSDIVNDYYANGLLRQRNNNNVVTGYTYYSNGSVRTVTDANQNTTTYSDYYRGIPQREEKANGIVFSRNVDYLGRVVSTIDGRGNTKSFTYDYMNRLLSIDPPLGNTVNITWPTQTDRVLTRGGFTETTKYNNQGYEIAKTITGEESILYEKQYDVLGRLIFESYPNSSQGITYTYDALDRLKTRTEPGGKTLTYTYQSPNRVDVTDGLNNTIQYFYRSFGNPDERELIGIVEPEGTVTQIRRNITGKVVRLTQNGLVRKYTYDNKRFLDYEENPETGRTDYSYDNVGNLTSKRINSTATGSLATVYEYDSVYRLTNIDYPSLYYIDNIRQASPVFACSAPCAVKRVTISDSFDYDNNDNRKQALREISTTKTVFNAAGTPANSSEDNYFDWRYDFDENNNLEYEQLNDGSNIHRFDYSYNGQDALVSTKYPSGVTINLFPDDYGRPTRVGSFVTDLQYHPTGAIKYMRYGNGITKTTGLSQRYSIGSISFAGIGNLSYSYNAADNITNIADSINNTGNKILGYDKQNRLTAASGPWGSASFDYDSRNNIIEKNVGATSVIIDYNTTTNKLNNYAVNGSNSAVNQDIYGNIISRGAKAFDYDHQGNLLGALTDSITYQYDANNRRTKQIDASGETKTIYGISGKVLHEVTSMGDRSDYIYLGNILIAKQTLEPDSDGDGVSDSLDAFPNDPSESVDSDGDGVGNNADAFPNDPLETADSDGDGVGDNADVFPNDPNETLDSDGDGVGDNADAFPNNPNETKDSDGDGIGDNQEIAILITIITTSLLMN